MEFERLYSTLKNYKIELPTVVLCYRLLKSANLPKDRRDLARATISDLTYEAMKKQIKAIHDQCSSSPAEFSTASDFEVGLDGNRGGRGGRGGRSGRFSNGAPRGTQGRESQRTIGPSKEHPCNICGSYFHWGN